LDGLFAPLSLFLPRLLDGVTNKIHYLTFAFAQAFGMGDWDAWIRSRRLRKKGLSISVDEAMSKQLSSSTERGIKNGAD